MSLNISLISSNIKNIKMMNLTAFKKLSRKFKAEIIIITPENIKKQKRNDEKIEENLQKAIPSEFHKYTYIFLKKILNTFSLY